MNIGIFTDTFFPQINGVATSTKTLERELTKMGHRVYIFTTTDPHATTEARVFRLPSMPFIFLKSHRFSVLYWPKAVKIIELMDLDIIHTQTEFSLGIFGRIVAKQLKIPLVHTYHTMYPDYVHYILNGHLVSPGMAVSFSKLACNLSRSVIVPTKKTEDFLTDAGVKRTIDIIPTGIDFAPFDRQNFDKETIRLKRESLGLSDTDKVIVLIGRIAQEKSMDVILRAMPEILQAIPETKLLVVGDGPARKQLELLSEALGVLPSVIFAGAQPWYEIGLFYALGDVFASASTTETQGLTFMEAIAAKTPVCAKNDPCLEGLVIHNDTGLLFERDKDAAQVLIQSLNNPIKATEMAENAYEIIQQYSAKAFASKVESVYQNVLNSWQPTRKSFIIKMSSKISAVLPNTIKPGKNK